MTKASILFLLLCFIDFVHCGGRKKDEKDGLCSEFHKPSYRLFRKSLVEQDGMLVAVDKRVPWSEEHRWDGPLSDSAVGAKCCLYYPWQTGGKNVSALESLVDKKKKNDDGDGDGKTMFLFLHFRSFKTFYRVLFPRIEAAGLRVVLVTALDDHSAPWELFTCGIGSPGGSTSTSTSTAVAAVADSTPLRRFLASPALRHWYTQNYDLLPSRNKRMQPSDCVQRIAEQKGWDSDLGTRPGDGDLMAKVSPIPIGGPRVLLGGQRTGCPARLALDAFAAAAQIAAAVPLSTRKPLRILAAFGDARLLANGTGASSSSSYAKKLGRISRESIAERFAMLSGLRASGPGVATVVTEQLDAGDYYRRLSSHAFAATPFSHGQDTYRFWEALALGAVPVLLHGPLDGLYAEFPAVFLDSWSGVTSASLEQWDRQIVERWGADPFANRSVQERLTSSYWAGVIRGGGE
jgi:hypothetical protein